MAVENKNNNMKGYPKYSPSEDPKLGKPYDLYGNDKSFKESLNTENPDVPGHNVTAEDFSKRTRTFNDVRDPNSNMFRYGLFFDEYSSVEDPTLLGFTCEIDDSENSPLFGTGEYSARAFINKYSNMPEIAARDTLLTQFQRNIKMMFKSQESTKTSESDFPYVKAHYLEKVVGLKVLSNKFIKYKEDELVFTMHEDVTMYAQYLAQLYNNLSYSFRNGKMMIPENLLRFNLVIKITEIRNFKTVVKRVFDATDGESSKRTLINVNSSQLRYTLYDCNFNFFESQNHGDDIQVGGIGGSVTSTSNMDFKLHFKNVSRFFKSEIVDDLQGTTNGRTDMNDREYNPRIHLDSSAFFKEAETQPDFGIDREPVNDFKKNDGPSNLEEGGKVYNQQQRDQNRTLSSPNMAGDPDLNENLQFDNNGNTLKGKAIKLLNKEKADLLNSVNRYKDSRIRDFGKLQQSLVNRGLGAVQDLKDGVLQRFREKRGELLNLLINELREETGIIQITPVNVYSDTFNPNSVQSIINDLGSTVGSDLEDFLRGFNNF